MCGHSWTLICAKRHSINIIYFLLFLNKADSRPQTGYSSKSAKTPRTPLTPEQNIFVQSAGCGPSRLNSRLYQNIPIGNPAAFKLKDFENIWAVDSELLVSDRQTSFGAHTYRDYRPNRLRLHSPGTDRSLASEDSNPVTKVHGSRRLDPLSPVIREIVLAIPRAKARGRDDIPLIASPLGSRGPVSHGSFVPAAASSALSLRRMSCLVASRPSLACLLAATTDARTRQQDRRSTHECVLSLC